MTFYSWESLVEKSCSVCAMFTSSSQEEICSNAMVALKTNGKISHACNCKRRRQARHSNGQETRPNRLSSSKGGNRATGILADK